MLEIGSASAFDVDLNARKVSSADNAGEANAGRAKAQPSDSRWVCSSLELMYKLVLFRSKYASVACRRSMSLALRLLSRTMYAYVGSAGRDDVDTRCTTCYRWEAFSGV